MAIDPGLLDILVCPACQGDLAPPEPAGIACRSCRRVYPVRDGIPVMLVDEAGPPAGGTEADEQNRGSEP